MSICMSISHVEKIGFLAPLTLDFGQSSVDRSYTQQHKQHAIVPYQVIIRLLHRLAIVYAIDPPLHPLSIG